MMAYYLQSFFLMVHCPLLPLIISHHNLFQGAPIHLLRQPGYIPPNSTKNRYRRLCLQARFVHSCSDASKFAVSFLPTLALVRSPKLTPSNGLRCSPTLVIPSKYSEVHIKTTCVHCLKAISRFRVPRIVCNHFITQESLNCNT